MWIREQRALRVQPEDPEGVEVRVLTPLGMWKRKIQKTAFYQVSHYYCFLFLLKINNYVVQGFYSSHSKMYEKELQYNETSI